MVTEGVGDNVSFHAMTVFGFVCCVEVMGNCHSERQQLRLLYCLYAGLCGCECNK